LEEAEAHEDAAEAQRLREEAEAEA